MQVPAIDQLAMAGLLDDGGYDRHVRRMRLVYRRRRAELAERLRAAGAPPLDGIAAGLHALLPVASPAAEMALVRDARRAGLLLHGLHANDYWHAPGGDRPAALVLGYATPPAHAWRRALEALGEVVQKTEVVQKSWAQPDH